jgi:hypothetical protein
MKSPINFYFAGKIKAHCWRHTLVDGLRDYGNHCEAYCCGFMEGAINGVHNYVGPFFIGCDHSCSHVSGHHGMHRGCETGCQTPGRAAAFHNCISNIYHADVVFAWIDSRECYGTIAEIGMAYGLKKIISIGVTHSLGAHRDFDRDLWFMLKMSTLGIVYAANAKAAFKEVLPKIEAFGCRETVHN